MSILNRITTLTKAAIHEGLNKLEDPVLLTGQYLRDLEEEISTAERNERDLKVAANILERRKHEYQVQAQRSEDEAVKAMDQGNEEGARVAVLAKLKCMESEQECDAGLEETRLTLSTLEANILRAKDERSRLKAKRAELITRARKAAATLNTAPHNPGKNPSSSRYGQSLNASSASRGFERMEEKITEWEALAEQSDQSPLTATSYPAIDPKISNAVDSELARLRSRNTNSKS